MSDFDDDFGDDKETTTESHTGDGKARPNVQDDEGYGVAAGELRQFVEQFEQLEAGKKYVAEQQKKLMSELKARGYDAKVFRKIIAERKRDKDDIAEEEAILEIYRAALGMG